MEALDQSGSYISAGWAERAAVSPDGRDQLSGQKGRFEWRGCLS